MPVGRFYRMIVGLTLEGVTPRLAAVFARQALAHDWAFSSEDLFVPNHVDIAPARIAELEIFFDLSCPFSLLAKLTIDELQRAAAVPARISWSPCILYPSLPANGIDFQSAHVGKYGARARELQRQVERSAASFGLTIDHERIAKVPNTIEAHCAVRFAAQAGRGAEMVEAVLRAYFTEYLDITDRDALETIVARVGLYPGEFRACLDSGQLRADVLAAHADSVQRGARSVPSYKLNGVHIENTTDLVPVLRKTLRPMAAG